MKKKICNLPRDLVEEVLCRVPLKSLRKVRLTYRKWNTLFKDISFAKKHLAQAKLAGATQGKSIMMVMMMGYRVCLMRFSLSNNVDESCIKPEAKLIGQDGSDEIYASRVFHCDGLLLCVCHTRDYSRLVVWNPYWGKTRWVKPTLSIYSLDFHAYALGYDMSSNSHKILRFVDFDQIDYQIYEFNSDSWRVLDVSPRDWMIIYSNSSVSLKGNTYWFATNTGEYFLICFDFTRETFGPHLPLPSVAGFEDTVSLSNVREEQLAVLFQPSDALQMEIWVTTKIEPNTVSWSSKVCLPANIKQLGHPHWQFQTAASFFIDEEKKVVVVFIKEKDIQNTTTRNVVYIIGVDGSVKEADARESPYTICNAFVCSYVPSLVQLN